MSAGLMSCVRENSPPLEMGDCSNMSIPPGTPDTQKRRRFLHPLRNLRRIFRRRTVAHADTIQNNSHVPQQQLIRNSNTTPSSSDFINTGIPTAGQGTAIGFYPKDKREHSADGLRNKKIAEELDREMTDYQRSFSEGRLIEGDFNRDTLSQSHDSVFSDSHSQTASSLSILKAELVDVLRKRRNRPDASDEDLGLPSSPTTPQRKTNQSDGSLSFLSTGSSDFDDDSSNFGNLSTSYSNKILFDSSRNSDEVDISLSVGSKLSHSAAKHKMAVRPNKKKGPTRHRRQHDSAVLPSTPEVNEDLNKVSSDITDMPSSKLKSQSLPPGVNSRIIDKHSNATIIKEQQVKQTTTETSKIYVNKNISKSHDFDSETNSSAASTLERTKIEDGFFKRLLHRSSNKKKKSLEEENDFDSKTIFENGEHKRIDSNGDYVKQGPEIKISAVNMHKVEEEISKIITSSSSYTTLYTNNKSEISSKIHRSGPASRQRVVPQDLTPIIIKLDEKLPPKSPKILPTSEEILIPCQRKISIENQSVSPPKTIWPENNLKNNPKIYGPYQQKISKIDTSSEKLSPKRKSVEKSKSFRFYQENSIDNLQNLPSLPDLTNSNKIFDDSINFRDSGPSSLNSPQIQGVFTKNFPSKSQIEENIDKIVKSSYVVLNKSTSMIESLDNSIKSKSISVTNIGSSKESIESSDDSRSSPVKIRRSASTFEKSTKTNVPEFMKIQLNRIDPVRPKSHVVLSKNAKEIENKERRFSNENVEISECKPPLPPDVVTTIAPIVITTTTTTTPKRNSLIKSQEIITTEISSPKSPIKKVFERKFSSSSLSDSVDENNENDRRKSDDSSRKISIEEDGVVVLRKKLIGSTKRDDTPELMKVFARRSLKVKDDFQVFEELLPPPILLKQTKQQPINVDSDKENQSSSEEKLDKLPKVEITISNNNNTNNVNFNNKTAPIIIKDEKKDLPKKIIEASLAKPFSTNKFGNVANFRNTTAFVDIRKNLQQQQPQPIIPSPTDNNRHTIAGATITSTKSDETDSIVENEFKNLVQRRAEWEKRAKEAFK